MFKPEKIFPDEELNLDYIVDNLVIAGDINSVVDQILAFREITGVPIILNTSFNENEPIVCNLSEAFDCFKRTHMDMLVVEKYVITRNL